METEGKTRHFAARATTFMKIKQAYLEPIMARTDQP